MALGAGGACAQSAAPDTLRARFETVRQQGSGKIVDRNVYLQSTEASGHMQGDVYALVDEPYDEVRAALTKAGSWCGILILHLNVKYCRAGAGSGGEIVTGVGRKVDQPLADVYWVRFALRVASADDAYLSVQLQAPTGPLSTTDYCIAVEAMPYAARQTLLRMSYSYAYGMAARFAMQAYLATTGSDKVGFSVVGKRSDGQPVLIDGVRGVLERNTMRYYLAIEAYLAAQGAPAAQVQLRSLQNWFDATERYPQQLHEVERDAYLEMKQHEVQRQQTEDPPKPDS